MEGSIGWVAAAAGARRALDVMVWRALASIGDTCLVAKRGYNQYGCCPSPPGGGEGLPAEVVSGDEDGVHLLPFDDVTGVGAELRLAAGFHAVRPAAGWLGRVIDPLARPLDQGTPLAHAPRAYPLP